jgi:hypothetical protein
VFLDPRRPKIIFFVIFFLDYDRINKIPYRMVPLLTDLTKKWPQKARKSENYNKSNGGLSRFLKKNKLKFLKSFFWAKTYADYEKNTFSSNQTFCCEFRSYLFFWKKSIIDIFHFLLPILVSDHVLTNFKTF